MIKMITNWYKAKKIELEMKALFYGYLKEFIDNQSDIIEFVNKLYTSMNGVSVDEFKDELIKQIVEMIHSESK